MREKCVINFSVNAISFFISNWIFRQLAFLTTLRYYIFGAKARMEHGWHDLIKNSLQFDFLETTSEGVLRCSNSAKWLSSY